MMPIIECPGAPTKHPRNNPMGELRRLAIDVDHLEPEHMDRLARIGNDIIRIYNPTPDFMIALHEFEDYTERWGVCSDVFLSFHDRCCEVSGLTPQDAEIDEVEDDGEPEVTSHTV